MKLMYEAKSLSNIGTSTAFRLQEHCRDGCRTRTADGLTSERLTSFLEMPWPQWSHPTLRWLPNMPDDEHLPMAEGTMLPGFAIGVAGMGVGERRLIRVPWRLGYGKKGKRPKIPPKSDLDFDASLTFCGIDWKRRVSHKPPEMSNKRREAAKRRGKKPRPA